MPIKHDLKFESIEVLPVKAEKIDIKNMEYIRESESADFPDVAFLIKFNINGEIPTDSCGMDLYLEDYSIRKFNQCAKGVFFKVYNPRFLTKHSGKEIYFRVGGTKKQATGIKFPILADQSAVDKLIESSSDIPLAESLIN